MSPLRFEIASGVTSDGYCCCRATNSDILLPGIRPSGSSLYRRNVVYHSTVYMCACIELYLYAIMSTRVYCIVQNIDKYN